MDWDGVCIQDVTQQNCRVGTRVLGKGYGEEEGCMGI